MLILEKSLPICAAKPVIWLLAGMLLSSTRFMIG
jgi:hypothetical protein